MFKKLIVLMKINFWIGIEFYGTKKSLANCEAQMI